MKGNSPCSPQKDCQSADLPHAGVGHQKIARMSTQIRFRLSGHDEAAFLEAARQTGLAPDAYARVRALTPIEPGAKLSTDLEARLEAMERRIAELADSQSRRSATPAAVVHGIGIDDLVVEIRREVRVGFNAILTLLDGDALPELPASPSQRSQRN